jgi:hypothetical protein
VIQLQKIKKNKVKNKYIIKYILIINIHIYFNIYINVYVTLSYSKLYQMHSCLSNGISNIQKKSYVKLNLISSFTNVIINQIK